MCVCRCGPLSFYPGSRGPNAERERKEKPEAKRRASGLDRWESHFHVGIWFRFLTLSLIGFLNSYLGATVDIWYNDDSYWLSISRHGIEVDNMEVRFSTAEARGPSLRFRIFLLLSLPLCVRASGTRVLSFISLSKSFILQSVNACSW